MSATIMTVCYPLLLEGRRICLGQKKVRLGQGLYNGFGGRLEPGENRCDVDTRAKTEVKEESGITVNRLEKLGIIIVTYTEHELIAELHIYRCVDFSGVPTESDEMIPQWFSFDDIPFEQMWPGDRYVIPYILTGQPFIGRLTYNHPKRRTLLAYAILPVDQVPETLSGLHP